MVTLSRRHAVAALGSLAATVALAPDALAQAATGGPHGGGRVRPLARAHAHNDYEHERPLLDALSHGFTSVEADIWLVDGELLVAHDAVDLDPSRTLRSLYLDPLERLVRRGHGSVYPGHELSVQLLIDIKNTGEATYQELSRQLRRYRRVLSSAVAGGPVRTRAVTAVISGERSARVPMEAEHLRYAFYDGRLDDLAAAEPAPASFIPLISSNWTSSFRWAGVGPFPASERELLHRIVTTAHARGQRVRFWATPDVPGPAREAVWRELLAAGVDHVNTDDLAGLEAFLRAEDS
ncbi:phosphatidylinositol-specific phospholipase C/glycerophosphodiester phosphodiesterase family protein [Streptomyces sp. 4N509B]|uniref:phosphatidylinositol-specific phospholipase C/glycerophosphodiester phosphodiesterase family protein n=1 Tax=Streptomyces sp. 4N509B TaxID=3457413 RepID=UPI003FD07EA0